MDEAALQAELMKEFKLQLQNNNNKHLLWEGLIPLDPTGAGGGTIGTGQAPLPQEQGFTGNNGQEPTQQTQATGQQQPPMAGVQ